MAERPPPLLPGGEPSATELQGLAWAGAIPVELSMKESEVTGLVPPLPHYILLPRCGYLPLAAAEAIDRFLRGFAADIQGPFTRRLWFETTEGGTPLQWHLPGGVLYDLYGPRPRPNTYASSDDEDEEEQGGMAAAAGAAAGAVDASASASAGRGKGRRRARRRGDEEGDGDDDAVVSPWRVTVRFHDIPLDQVLELPVEPSQAREAAMRHFRGRLKQACYLLHGGSGPAMGMQKDDEVALWEAVAAASYNRYVAPAAKLWTDKPQRIPLRLLVEGQPALHPSLTSEPYAALTLGEAVRRAAPHLFDVGAGDGGEHESALLALEFTCQGLCPPPWDAPLVEAWRALRHADFYLYLTARRPLLRVVGAATADAAAGAEAAGGGQG